MRGRGGAGDVATADATAEVTDVVTRGLPLGLARALRSKARSEACISPCLVACWLARSAFIWSRFLLRSTFLSAGADVRGARGRSPGESAWVGTKVTGRTVDTSSSSTYISSSRVCSSFLLRLRPPVLGTMSARLTDGDCSSLSSSLSPRMRFLGRDGICVIVLKCVCGMGSSRIEKR